MEQKKQGSCSNGHKWLLFFYTVPSKPVSNRMTIWRKLIKSGAAPLKGSVYVLPFSSDHYEFLQWLVSEVAAMNGDGALVSIDKVETMSDTEIIGLFHAARKNDYLPLAGSVDDLAKKWDSMKKGGQISNIEKLTAQLDKIKKSFEEVQKIDFFAAQEGVALLKKIKSLLEELRQGVGPYRDAAQPAELSRKSINDYRDRTWLTRKSPFVDRMASAWLIKRFIDPDASFEFIDSNQAPSLPEKAVVFDVFGGEFTHVGELCTFEVLIRTFGLKDKTVKQIAEIIHNLDIKDDKYQVPEARGIEGILTGIRKTAKDDNEALAQGMQVFEMLYVSKQP